MKSPLLAVVALLQLATLGLLVILAASGNGSPRDDGSIDRLTQSVQGALNQERIIIQYLDELRRQAAGAAPTLVATEPKPLVDPPPATAPLPASPFPAAAAALAELKRIEQSLRDERKDGGQNLGPLQTEVARRRSTLIAFGHEAVYVVRREVDLQPFEAGRDAAFVQYLVEAVVPALSSNAKAEAFDIARSALVRATNEASIKLAAARALQAIDPNRWVKEVGDVIGYGSGIEADLRAQLLGLFIDSPRPQAVELCQRFLDDPRAPIELKVKSILVLEKQDSSAVVPTMEKVLFEQNVGLLKLHALDALWNRLKDPAERRRLAQKVLDEDPARMPINVQEKAKNLLATLDPTGGRREGGG